MKFEFSVDFGYWSIPFGFGCERGFFWIGFLCFNWDVSWKTIR